LHLIHRCWHPSWTLMRTLFQICVWEFPLPDNTEWSGSIWYFILLLMLLRGWKFSPVCSLCSILKENKLSLHAHDVVCDTCVKLQFEFCVIGGYHSVILIFPSVVKNLDLSTDQHLLLQWIPQEGCIWTSCLFLPLFLFYADPFFKQPFLFLIHCHLFPLFLASSSVCQNCFLWFTFLLLEPVIF
jgi:hypothetical protein